jgi:threonine synthase
MVGRRTIEAMPRIDDPPTFVTHLECSATGEQHPAGEPHGLSRAGSPLLVRYDLAGLAAAVDRDRVDVRPADLWRFREFLPTGGDVVSLGEPATPLIPLTRTGAAVGSDQLFVKDEGRLPTGSFKARGMAVAVSMAREFGITSMALPTNGNAGAALAAYGTRAGIDTYIFCPSDTPEINVRETALQGGRVRRVDGLIDDCGRMVAEGAEEMGWFDASTLKEPYRIEGKKTMGLELAQQLGWELPDVILYPTGGGTGLIGMWKAFQELEAVGWIRGGKPRMVAVQASGCAPIVRAFEQGADRAQRWENAHTVASGIRVPSAIGDSLILAALRESGGFAIATPDDEILQARDDVAAFDGLLLCPEGAATLAAYRSAVTEGLISTEEKAVLFNCATGLKYPMPAVESGVDDSALR